MEELLKFLEKNPVFYLATDDEGQPRVRPFGFHMVFDGKFYMVTALPKKVCKQMEKNPRVEFCTMAPDTKFVRVNGEVVFDNDNMQAKENVFKVMPDLLKMYGRKSRYVGILSQRHACDYSFPYGARNSIILKIFEHIKDRCY